jgi:hypothetical protein
MTTVMVTSNVKQNAALPQKYTDQNQETAVAQQQLNTASTMLIHLLAKLAVMPLHSANMITNAIPKKTAANLLMAMYGARPAMDTPV